MKNVIFKLLVFLLIICGVAFNYSNPSASNSLEDVISAIDGRNVNQLSGYFDNVVEITLHSRSHTYSKSQAEVILKDFFYSHKVKTFEILHKESADNSAFCVGSLETRYGAFRTTIYMKSRLRKLLIQEICIVDPG